MITATYHPNTNVHAIAQIVALTLAVFALLLVPVLLTAIAPYIYVCVCCIAKTFIVTAAMAIVPSTIYFMKGK